MELGRGEIMWKYKNEDKDIITNSYYMISLFMEAREDKSLEDFEDAEDINLQIITNLKLQVLMYLSEAYYMCLYNKKMFDSEWYAWNYCPANKELYHKYNCFGGDELIVSEKDIKRANNLSQENKDVIDLIYNLFGGFSAFDLVCIMHTKETPLMVILADNDDKDFCSISEIEINKKETKKWFNEGIMSIIRSDE